MSPANKELAELSKVKQLTSKSEVLHVIFAIHHDLCQDKPCDLIFIVLKV